MRPPRLAEAILALALPAREREEVLGDAAEGYARRRRREGGALAAWFWYWRHAVSVPARLWWRGALSGASGAELRHAVRSLRRSPAFTTVALLSLSLGIGANTAIFSVVRSVLFTPLEVENPEELRLVYNQRPEAPGVKQLSSSSETHPITGVPINSNYSYPMYQRLRAAVGPSVGMLAYSFAREVAVVVDSRPALSADALMASGDYFSTLRPSLVLGRGLTPSDDRAEAPRVAVISYAFWQRAFGGESSAIGSIVRVNGAPFEIIGVTAPDFHGLSPGGFFAPTEITVPLSAQAVVAPTWAPEGASLLTAEDYFWLRLIVRLEKGAPAAAIEDAMSAAFRESLVEMSAISAEDGELARVHFIDGSRGVDSLRRDITGSLRILAGVVAVVLLIACVNLASLMLARGAARQRELALRRALGAGRWRLIRQLFLESVALAAAGGAAGLLLAVWSGPAVTAALTASMGPVAVRFRIDGVLLAAVTFVSFVAATLCGVLPALRLTRRGAYDSLRARDFGAPGGRVTLGRVLIAAQIAVSIPLIVAAGLFLRTLGNLTRVDLGFDADNLVIFHIDPSMVTDDTERVAAIYRDILENLESLPGVRSTTLLENALLSGWTSNTRVQIAGREEAMYMNAVGPRYFETMGIPLLSGRTILPTDDTDAPLVMVVNETAAKQLFDGHPLGRSVIRGDNPYEVVGVVADSKYESLQRDIQPTFYDSHLQRPLRSAHVLVRTSVPVDRLERSIREIVARTDPGLPVDGLRSQRAQIDAATSRERVFARLLALFGGFALLVACVGLYGVTSFAVARRRAELGVRLALGARPPQIVWLVLRSVLVLVGIGLAVGLVAAYLVGPVVDSLLYGLEPGDPLTLVGAALLMLCVAVAAGWLPALRAARTDALIVLSRD